MPHFELFIYLFLKKPTCKSYPLKHSNGVGDKFNICMRTCVRTHYAHIRARVMNSISNKF